ncbi:putative short-chain dehydrogenase [Biscogniauxia marginata]|nr:putative short-chain dehydrogenase [Biscogniauxia marginata]
MPKSYGTVLVTGANGGLGSAIVSKIVSTTELRAYHGIYTVRNAAAATPALDTALRQAEVLPAISTAPPHSYDKLSLDLSQLSHVREVAKMINSRVAAGELPPIRAVVLNAGHQEFGTQTWTSDGLDTTFVVNYLSHWLLLLLLLRSMDRENGRVVWISSWSHNRDHPFQLHVDAYKDKYSTVISDSLEPIANGTWSANKDDDTAWAAGYRRYGASKLCSMTMLQELQRRLDQDPVLNNISVLAVDPGTMATDIVRRSNSWFIRVLMFKILLPALVTVLTCFYPDGPFRTPKKSAGDVVAAAFDCGPPPLRERPKGLYLDGSKLGEYSPDAKDPMKREVVWKGSVQYAQLKEGESVLKMWE